MKWCISILDANYVKINGYQRESNNDYTFDLGLILAPLFISNTTMSL